MEYENAIHNVARKLKLKQIDFNAAYRRWIILCATYELSRAREKIIERHADKIKI